jgi:predicted enzyme involved in methoxymalonyl-ACP biosynthesis
MKKKHKLLNADNLRMCCRKMRQTIIKRVMRNIVSLVKRNKVYIENPKGAEVQFLKE